jgi:hypothetical protein
MVVELRRTISLTIQQKTNHGLYKQETVAQSYVNRAQTGLEVNAHLRSTKVFGVRRPDAALLVFFDSRQRGINRSTKFTKQKLKKRRRAAALQRLESSLVHRLFNISCNRRVAEAQRWAEISERFQRFREVGLRLRPR